MRLIRTKVSGRFTWASRVTSATVTIDRERGMLAVRPLRSRREYCALLSDVAELIVERAIKAECAGKRTGRGK